MKKDVSTFINNVDDIIKQIVVNSTIEVFTDIIDDSPIDTGAFVGNWNLTNEPFNKSLTSTHEVVMDDIQEQVKQRNSIDPITLSNSAPYGELLEFGSSAQAPSGFIRTNAKRWTEIVERNAKKVIK